MQGADLTMQEEIIIVPQEQHEVTAHVPEAEEAVSVSIPKYTGDNGATFYPSVSEDGVLSWSNDKGLENPPPVNIKGPKGNPGTTPTKGKDYFDGAPGVSATHEWNGTVLTVHSASGTSSADLKGEKGNPGKTPVKGVDYFDGEPGKPGYTPVKGKDYFDGEPGKTPVKGTDYYTPDDKAEMVAAVLAALPVYKGEVVAE